MCSRAYGQPNLYQLMLQVAESGAHVIATARELDQSPGLQSLLEKYGDKGPLQIVRLDISDVESIKVRLGSVMRLTDVPMDGRRPEGQLPPGRPCRRTRSS